MRQTPEPRSPEVLPRAECERLLAQAETARVAWVDKDRARVVPVAITVRDGAVLFRTGPGSKLDAAVAGVRFTVEAERLEPALHTGWSVEVVGRASVRAVAADEPEPAPWLIPWVPLDSVSLVAVAIEEIAGRRLPPPSAQVEMWSWRSVEDR